MFKESIMDEPEVIQVIPSKRRLASNWAHSVYELNDIDFEWTIHHFMFHTSCKPLKWLHSPEFSEEEFPDIKWKLELRPSEDQKSFRVNLRCSEQTQDIPIKFKFGYVNDDRKTGTLRHFYTTIPARPKVLYMNLDNIEFSKFSSTILISDDGHLTIYCKIEHLSPLKTFSGKRLKQDYKSLSSSKLLLKDFKKLFEDTSFADVTFKLGDKTFRAHKAILVARCPVFAAMFNQEMKEKISDHVDVNDVRPEVFQELLRFIYTGRVQRMEEFGIAELLIAADKYLLENLKQRCAASLAKQLSKENCLEILVLADQYSLVNLKDTAIDFLRHNIIEIRASNSWEEFKQKSPTWLCETLMELFKDFPSTKNQSQSSLN